MTEIYFEPGLTPVLKHPGHSDQKVHGRRGPGVSVKPEVAGSILERVKANGGLSVNMLDGSEPTTGFMVAKGGTKGDIVDADEFFDAKKGPAHLSSFLKTHKASLTKGSYLGLWHNTEDGKVYLDVSDNIKDRGKAITAGKRRNQISIWDVANFKEIGTGGTGELAKEIAGSGVAGFVDGYGRRDRQVRATDLGEVRSDSVVVKFAPGLVPLLKHGDLSRPGYAAMHPDSQGRIGVHTGRRTDAKNQAKADANLIHEATSLEALPADMQGRVNEGLTTLGITSDQMDANIEATLSRANIDGADPAGQNWYGDANAASKDISERYGVTHEQSAGMIAATSPQQPWGDNVTAVEYMAKATKENHEIQTGALMDHQRTKGKGDTRSLYEWAKSEVDGRTMDGEIHNMPAIAELQGKRMSDIKDPYVRAALMKAQAQMGYRVSGIGTNKDGQSLKTVDDLTGLVAPVKFTCGVQHLGRAVRISDGEQPDMVLNGHKVRSFYNNIRNPKSKHDDITVDSHAFSIAMGKKYGSGSDEYKYFSGSGWKARGASPVSNKTLGVSGLYPAFADSYRRVAAKHGLSAHQVQSITWVQWRKDNPDQTRGGQMAREAANAG